MAEDNTIVLVQASFCEGQELFGWIRRFAKTSDKHFAYYDEFAFTTDLLAEYDAILVFNSPKETISVLSDPGKVIAMMMEPGVKSEHPWMFQGLNQYSQVYSPIASSANSILSHGYMGWYFPNDLRFLEQLPVPQKPKQLSCIVSNLKQLKGHRLRLSFVNQLRLQFPEMDMFGKGIAFIENKLDGLLPYQYSIAIENSSIPNYFTEKINDCFLAYSVPFYYGCQNIDKYFPSRSYIPIAINNPAAAFKTIRASIDADDWSSRLDAVKEARELVLHKYQPLAGASSILRKIPPSSKQHIQLNPVSPGIKKRLLSALSQIRKRKNPLI